VDSVKSDLHQIDMTRSQNEKTLAALNATSVSVVYLAIESVRPIELRLVLDQLNVFGTRTFRSLSDVEGDFLAFT